jgi:hypothetical protein
MGMRLLGRERGGGGGGGWIFWIYIKFVDSDLSHHLCVPVYARPYLSLFFLKKIRLPGSQVQKGLGGFPWCM